MVFEARPAHVMQISARKLFAYEALGIDFLAEENLQGQASRTGISLSNSPPATPTTTGGGEGGDPSGWRGWASPHTHYPQGFLGRAADL